MQFLHYDFDGSAGDVVEVTLDHAANVQLLDPGNYSNYKQGKPFRYHGGYVRQSPYQLSFPHSGRWHLVVDLGGSAGTVRAAARVIPATHSTGAR